MTGALAGFNATLGNDGAAQPMSQLQTLINSPGGLQSLGINPANFTTMAGKYLGGAGRASEALSGALEASRNRTGQLALADLNTTAGANGNIGGTVSGIGKLDLASRFGQQAAQDEATVAAAKEAGIRGRMGDVFTGGGLMLNDLATTRGQNLSAQEQLAALQLQHQQQMLAGYSTQYGLQSNLNDRPMNYASGNYQSWLQRPQQQSDLGAVIGGVGALAGAASGLGWNPLAGKAPT
jgi:hypothetical protein